MNIYAFADEASSALAGQIAALRRNQLNGLEIRNVDGESVSNISLQKAREIRDRLNAEGLTIWSVGSPIGKISIDEAQFEQHLDLFKATLDIARALDCQNIRLFSFYIPAERPVSAYRQKVLDQMARFADAARGSGIALCHENEKGIYGARAAECVDLMEHLPSMRAIFDPANFIQCGQETASAWAMLKPYVKYLHIKDALADGRVVPAGEGVGHVREIVHDFMASGGRALSIEPHLKVFSGLDALENGQKSRFAHQYESRDAAFDAACQALQSLLA